MTTRVLHRVVFPEDADIDVLPLYVDVDQSAFSAPAESDSDKSVHVPFGTQNPDHVLGRRSIVVLSGTRASTATYFNAFPASYWRRWTVVERVRLDVTLSGDGRVMVYRSTASGQIQRVDHQSLSSDVATTFSFELPLSRFGDGGWYWFDLVAGHDDLVLIDAEYCCDVPPETPRGSATLAITTFNRPDFCVAQLDNLGAAPEVLDVVDEVIVVDQGTRKVRDEPRFAQGKKGLAGRLRVMDQANLGGSGGFARGMYETIQSGRSDYVLLLDDDVVLETDGVLRAIAFADLCRKPTIVGGHMLNIYERSTLHSWGETVNLYRFFWGPVRGFAEAHNLASRNLRDAPWMHRRCDVDYNGWWMCLIPSDVLRQIGLALPAFIKWDDAEFGLRAKRAGFRTVTLPGTAVWHVPWTDKDDTIDWQAYFHQRNRWLVALLYSPYPRGGNLPRESFMVDLKHLLAQQYSATELRLQALEDLLEGPHRLHSDLGRKLPQIRSVRGGFVDAQVLGDPAQFPEPRLPKPPRKGKIPSQPAGVVSGLLAAASGSLRALLPARETARLQPEVDIAAMDARWWMISRFDSSLVTSADGTGASWYQRQPDTFRGLLSRSALLHQRLLREWDQMAQRYRLYHSEIVSAGAWEHTFGIRPAEQ